MSKVKGLLLANWWGYLFEGISKCVSGIPMIQRSADINNLELQVCTLAEDVRYLEDLNLSCLGREVFMNFIY